MTARPKARHEQAQQLQDALRRRLDEQAQQSRANFEQAMAAMLQRVETRPPLPPPPPEPPPPPAIPQPRPRPPTTRRRPAAPAVPTPLTEVHWSNRAVLGYRMWDVRGGRLHGAWTPWETPRKTARCLDRQSKAKGPVPHDAAECRHPPCGIYALKDTRKVQALTEKTLRTTPVPLTLAVGLVAMTGRVIEHTMGYRAEHVEVVSLALLSGAVGTDTVVTTLDTPGTILAAFTDPRASRNSGIVKIGPTIEVVARAMQHLQEREVALR